MISFLRVISYVRTGKDLDNHKENKLKWRENRHFVWGMFWFLMLVCGFCYGFKVAVDRDDQARQIIIESAQIMADIHKILSWPKPTQDYVNHYKTTVVHLNNIISYAKPTDAFIDAFSDLINTVRDSAKLEKVSPEVSNEIKTLIDSHKVLLDRLRDDGNLSQEDISAITAVLSRKVDQDAYDALPWYSKIFTFNSYLQTKETLEEIEKRNELAKEKVKEMQINQIKLAKLFCLDATHNAAILVLTKWLNLPVPIATAAVALIAGIPGLMLMIFAPIFYFDFKSRQFAQIEASGVLMRIERPLAGWQYILSLFYSGGFSHLGMISVFAFFMANLWCGSPFLSMVAAYSLKKANKARDEYKTDTWSYAFWNCISEPLNHSDGFFFLVLIPFTTNGSWFLFMALLQSYNVHLPKSLQFLELKKSQVMHYVPLNFKRYLHSKTQVLAILTIIVSIILICYLHQKLNVKYYNAIKRNTIQPKQMMILRMLGLARKAIPWIFPGSVGLTTLIQTYAAYFPVAEIFEPIANSTYLTSGVFYWVLWAMKALFPLPLIPAYLHEQIMNNGFQF